MCPIIHLSLPTYAVLAVIGLFVSILFVYLKIDKYNISFTNYLKMILFCVVFGFLGSRLLYLISRIPWLITHFSIINLLNTVLFGGFVFYGGLLGVIFGIYLFCKKYSYKTTTVYNLVAPTFPLFHTFGRIGCLMAGCCYGVKLSPPITIFDTIIINRVPTQIIEAFFELILFFVLFKLQKKNDNIDLLRAYLIVYSVFRFILEFFRGDEYRGIFFVLSTSQMISTVIILFYLFRFINGKINNKRSTITS